MQLHLNDRASGKYFKEATYKARVQARVLLLGPEGVWYLRIPLPISGLFPFGTYLDNLSGSLITALLGVSNWVSMCL